jgi:hypothetical protein
MSRQRISSSMAVLIFEETCLIGPSGHRVLFPDRSGRGIQRTILEGVSRSKSIKGPHIRMKKPYPDAKRS